MLSWITCVMNESVTLFSLRMCTCRDISVERERDDAVCWYLACEGPELMIQLKLHSVKGPLALRAKNTIHFLKFHSR